MLELEMIDFKKVQNGRKKRKRYTETKEIKNWI